MDNRVRIEKFRALVGAIRPAEFSPAMLFAWLDKTTYPQIFTKQIQRVIPKKFWLLFIFLLRGRAAFVNVLLPQRTFGEAAGHRTPRGWSKVGRDLGTDLWSESLWVRARERGNSSEMKR